MHVTYFLCFYKLFMLIDYSVNILNFTVSYDEVIGCFNADLTNFLVSIISCY